MIDAISDEVIATFDWSKVQLQTQLPASQSDFFEQHGMTPSHPDSRRRYHRFFLRSKAIMRRNDAVIGVFSIDASRSGLAFLSPIELAIKERVSLRLPKTKEFQLEIARCRKIEENCYECGAVFVLGK